jgi:glutathione S-transferase
MTKITTKPQPELYWISGSPYAWRVMLTLEVKQARYASHLLEASKGDLKKPEYLRLNPRGRVPTLKHGEHVLNESLAIMAYLDRAFPTPSIFGESAHETARNWRLISEFFSYLYPPLNRVIAPLYAGKTAEKADDMRAALPVVHEELGRLERALGDAAWLGGQAVSAADIAIYPFMKSLLRAASKDAAAAFNLGVLPLSTTYPRLADWTQNVERIPGFARTYPPHWREAQAA